MENEATQPQEVWCLDLVQDLGALGIECRRLKNLKGSRSTAHVKECLSGQVGKAFAPVRSKPRRQDPKPSKMSKLVSESAEVNVNMRRLEMALKRCDMALASPPSRMRSCSSAKALLTPSISEQSAADIEQTENAHALPNLLLSSVSKMSKGSSEGLGSTCSTADERSLDSSFSCTDSDDCHSTIDCLSPLAELRMHYNVTEANMGESCNAAQ